MCKLLQRIMKLVGIKTEEISVDASELQEQINNLSKKIDILKSTPNSDFSAYGDMLDILHDKIQEVEKYCANSSSTSQI